MAIGTPTVGTYFEHTTATSSAVPYPTTVNAGDFLVLIGSHKLAGSTNITNPSGWTQQFQGSPNANATTPDTYVGTKFAAGTEGGTTLTVAHTSAATSWQILAFSGVDQTTPLDVAISTVDNAAATTTVIPAMTIATANAAIVACAAINSTVAGASPPTGFTETGDRSTGSSSLEISYKLNQATGSTGTITVNWGSNSGRSVGIALALRPAASGATGTFAATEANDTLAASGTETFTGTLAATEGNDTLAASGTETISGTLAATEANDTLAGSGAETFTGTLAATEGNDTLAASGVSTNGVAGTFAATEANDTLAATGVEKFTGTLAATEGNDTLAAVAVEKFTGTFAATEGNDSLVAAGAEKFLGTLAATEAPDTLAATGTERITGTLAATEAPDALAAVGTVGSAGPSRDITLTGSLLPQRITGALEPARLTGAVKPARITGDLTPARIAGTIAAPRLTGQLEDA